MKGEAAWVEAYSSGDVWISLGVCSNLGELGDSLLETPTDWESDASVSFRVAFPAVFLERFLGHRVHKLRVVLRDFFR